MISPSKLYSIYRKFQGRRAPRRAKRNFNPVLSTPNYLNRHVGTTILVLGTGPTLRTHGQDIHRLIDKYQAIVLGPNHITPFIYPDYHAFTNRRSFAQYAETIDPAKSNVLLSPYFADELIDDRFSGPFEHIMYIADNDAAFHIRDGVIQSSCRTVSVLLIGVAITMGAERVLVAGLDGLTQPNLRGLQAKKHGSGIHYTDTMVYAKQEDAREVQMINETCQRYLDQIEQYMTLHGPEPFRIVTPTIYSNHYQDISSYL